MQWSKIKNIIILILLTVNILLLGQVVIREMESGHYHHRARKEMTLLLAQSGIRVELDSLPADTELRPMQCEREERAEAALAEALLGPVSAEADGSYTGEAGSIWFYSSGEFYAVLRPGHGLLREREAERAAREALGRLGIESEVTAIHEQEGSTTVRTRQTWEDIPIFSCETILLFEGDELREMRGKRLPGAPVERAGEKGMTVITALLRFLSAITESGYVCSEIRDMDLGYEMTAIPTSSTFRLTPVWQVESDVSTFLLEQDGTLIPLNELWTEGGQRTE